MTSVSFRGGRMEGKVSPPPSKSHTHRAFFLASMAGGRSSISNALLSDDTRSTLDACRSMGASVTMDGRKVIIDGGNLHAPEGVVDAGNSGTTMRIFAGLCSMFDTEVTITGDASLRKRPMGPLLDALSAAGTECISEKGLPPVRIKGPSRGGEIRIDGSVSSQFITALLMVSPMIVSDSIVIPEKGIASAPYLDVTTHMMGLFGAKAERTGDRFRIKGGTGYAPYDYAVPADFSSAAFPLAAGALGGTVTVDGMDLNDPQGDRRIVDIIRAAGAQVSVDGDRVTAKKGGSLACDIDMGDVPDLFPITAVLLSAAKGESRLYGAPQLRFKESDRIKTVTEMINAIGGDAEATEDGCVIRGKGSLSGGRIEHKGDHRIMMSAAVASLVCDGPVIMDDAECHAVSYPGFIDQMRSLGMDAEVL